MCACPGLPSRMPNVRWAMELTNDVTPPLWPTEIEYIHFDCEVNPFTGRPFFNEVVFFHRPSKTVFMADVFWNYPSSRVPNYVTKLKTSSLDGLSRDISGGKGIAPIDVPFGTRLWKFGMDRIYLPFYKRVMVGSRRDVFVKRVETLLAWEPEIIIPCHGDVVLGRDLCRDVLERHLLQ